MEITMTLPTLPISRTGIEVSRLGLGTVKWGRNQQVKYPAFELPDDSTLHALLDIAESAGLNLLDTAPAYGIAEERLGKILAERRQSPFVVMTKTGEEFINGMSCFDFSVQHTESSVIRSLRRLRSEALDLVMVHCSANDLGVLDQTPVLENLQKLRDKGHIRAIGVSTMTVEGGLLAVEVSDAVMVPFSFGYQAHLPVIEKAHRLGKAVFIKRALYSGPAQDSQLPLREMLSPVIQTPGVTSVIAGTINPLHLKENIEALLA
jgi:aryl-alcohol dehydrogenase-like predicted oxidoreductase